MDKHAVPALRYPLQINYAKAACMKHSYVLFGEVPDTPGPLAQIRINPRIPAGADTVADASAKLAKELEQFVNRVWSENDGRALQQEAGMVQMVTGGAVFRVGWQPDDGRSPLQQVRCRSAIRVNRTHVPTQRA